MPGTNAVIKRARNAKTDTDAVTALTELVSARAAIKEQLERETAPLQAQYEDLDRKLNETWARGLEAQAEIDAEIRRLGAIVAGPPRGRKYSMPRKKPVAEARILSFFRGTNVLYRPAEIAQALGVESTPAFRKMLRAMAEDGLIDQSGERGGSKYCARGAALEL